MFVSPFLKLEIGLLIQSTHTVAAPPQRGAVYISSPTPAAETSAWPCDLLCLFHWSTVCVISYESLLRDNVCLFFLLVFFSIMVHHRMLNVVPCVIQSDLVVSPFSISQLASANPKLLSHPSPPQPWPPQVCFVSVSLFIFHR